MESTKTQKMVLAAMLAALGMILNLIEIPYPFAPWLNLDLSEIVVLVAISTLGFIPALFVCICKFVVSILFKGPVGPMAIGQIAALIASLSICVTYSLLARKIDPEKNLKNYFLDMVLTMLVFAFIMFVINYFFVTPTYLMQKPTWYTNLPFAVDIQAFNQQYGSNISIPKFLSFLSPYGQAIFIIYFPFNFIKGIITGIVYYLVRPVEKSLKVNILKKLRLLLFFYSDYYVIMARDGGKMTYSRVKKYQELRDGLKEEVGISKEKYVEPVQNDDDDDDFLSFMKKDKEEKEVNLEDTLTETKTFEQMREEGSAELDKALKSAKESVGKQDQYNTRMDILSKIREPEKNTIKIDSVESYATQEFAKGMFVNNKVEEEPKEKMTFMEKLAAMSPEEDVKKAEEFLQQESEEVEEKQAEEITETKEIVETIEENPVEDIEENDTFIEDEEIIENKGESKAVKVMNVIIVILVIIFIALLGVILYQSFF